MTTVRSAHKGEYFVGNINTDIEKQELEALERRGIKYRIGDTAFDVAGNPIDQVNIKPLIIIGKASFDAYNSYQQQELHDIRAGKKRV